MHLCKYLRIFLLSSSLLFIPFSVTHASEVNSEVNENIEVNENERVKTVSIGLTPKAARENGYTHVDLSRIESITNHSSSIADSLFCFEVNGGGGTWFDHTNFTISFYKGASVVKSLTPSRGGNFRFSDLIDDGTQFDTIRIAWDDKFKNATAGNVNIAFKSSNGAYTYGIGKYEYNSTIKEPEVPEPPVVVPDTNINIDSSGDSSDILNSIVNAIKEFIATLLTAGMFIIKRAVALGVIFIGGRWLWRKVRQWLSSV